MMLVLLAVLVFFLQYSRAQTTDVCTGYTDLADIACEEDALLACTPLCVEPICLLDRIDGCKTPFDTRRLQWIDRCPNKVLSCLPEDSPAPRCPQAKLSDEAACRTKLLECSQVQKTCDW